jgi:hypothetical protein
MRQNLVDLSFAAEAVEDIERALDTLDVRFAPLIALTPRQRQRLTKMGSNSEAFCRQALQLVQQHPGLVPRDFDEAACLRDLHALEHIRQWRTRFTRLYERMADTETALGSDLMVAALKAYAFLKVAGDSEGLDTARSELAARFARSSRRHAAKGTEPPASES